MRGAILFLLHQDESRSYWVVVVLSSIDISVSY